MTFNATLLDEVKAAGRLTDFVPVDDGVTVRLLHFTPELNALTNGDQPDTGFPTRLADPVLGRFVLGQCMWVCLSKEPDRKVDVDLKRLVDANEVWTFRFANVRRRINGWRMLGRFADYNRFVALRAYPRNNLATQWQWTEAIEQTLADWQAIFGNMPAHAGQDVDAYLSRPHQDVTQS